MFSAADNAAKDTGDSLERSERHPGKVEVKIWRVRDQSYDGKKPES